LFETTRLNNIGRNTHNNQRDSPNIQPLNIFMK